MSCEVVADTHGVEAWCEECSGSVAYSTDAWHAWEIAAAAARLHSENHGAIFLDAEGRPTLTPTSWYAGGCSNLLEESRALQASKA
ncbi:hypothetical protein E3O55_08590 [Cryobacterium sp. MDB1-18-2]|uniref:hypothetical protein n=1 Tax=unclassified Cryobacterium TaxID=2649013 RepID=UPI00106DBFA5|nr:MULTISPECIES: hypothetical protein [unclassified Cryobacterium]TFC30130.1 hypothetical protein E3O55_08590 [Cryobacterium sp. MDB1-18-2]TFC41410.1 hypothetical protein E3O50_10030 [Cryobacterium sp. MDB1-18-1]